jgi:hypothetical protein
VVAQRLAEDLMQKAGVERGFLLEQVALGVELGPTGKDLGGTVLPLATVDGLVGLVGQVLLQHQGAAAALGQLDEQVRRARGRSRRRLGLGHPCAGP